MLVIFAVSCVSEKLPIEGISLPSANIYGIKESFIHTYPLESTESTKDSDADMLNINKIFDKNFPELNEIVYHSREDEFTPPPKRQRSSTQLVIFQPFTSEPEISPFKIVGETLPPILLLSICGKT